MQEPYCYTVSDAESKKRIDALLSSYPKVSSRTMAQRLLKIGLARVNGQLVAPAYKVRAGDEIRFSLPAPEPLAVASEAGNLDILFEDHSLIVVNKPSGLVVHPAPGHASGTLVNLLLHHCQDLSGIGGILRPGIVHRLDKGTSGVLVVAKTDAAHRGLSEQFQQHSIQRTYHALIWGNPLQNKGTINAPLARNPHHRKKMAIVANGKSATTHWKVIVRFRHFTLLECRLETGRTHQIRVHLSSQSIPVVGDPQYGQSHLRRIRVQPSLSAILSQFNHQALHAQTLGFIHPITQTPLEFTAPVPADFQKILDELAQWDI
ncbi:MAG: RluA family pseudouridine synthase [SAR324 cluster bacterium]|nr:RluA family pseudouridine synthase [SAR324 cluster bacterium]